MKTIKLSEYECQVIVDYLRCCNICNSYCYCSYVLDKCQSIDAEGIPECKLQKTIQSILNKLESDGDVTDEI